MVDIDRAIFLIKKATPKGRIERYVEYKNWYVFHVSTPDPYEGDMDGIYSVDKATGECCDFPYLDTQYFKDIMDLFEKAQPYQEPPKEPLSQKVKTFLNAKKPFKSSKSNFFGRIKK